MTENYDLNLTPSQLKNFIIKALSFNQVPYIAGPPGIGKSQIVHQIAKENNAEMIDIRLSQMLSEDLTGLPERNPDKGKAYYLPFDVFPLEDDPVPEGKTGWILFLDELSSASEEILAAVYSVILDRTLGNHKLHPKCRIVAAGNLSTDSAIARELPDTLITRMLPVKLKISYRDWIKWAKTLNPPVSSSIINYIERNGSHLHSPVKSKDKAELEPYPTPRGWEKVFAYISDHEKKNKNQSKNDEITHPLNDTTYFLMAAAIGTMAASSFREYYKSDIEIPEVWEISQSPETTRIPDSPIQVSKLVKELAEYWELSDEEIQNNVVIYIARLDEEEKETFCSYIKHNMNSSDKEIKHYNKTRKDLNLSSDGNIGSSATLETKK